VKIARVVGNVVATIQAPIFEGRRLLLCALLDAEGRPTADPRAYTIAVDTVGAGAGETVLILDEGNSARQIVGDPTAPIRAVVVGIVDAVETDGGQAADG
jgi:ethanolamine utilization protein EutN